MSSRSTASFTAATTTQHTNRRPPRKPDVRIIQNYLVVWLDANIDENEDDYQNSIAMLREVSNTVNTFTDADECITFINGITPKKAFMISSGFLGQTTVPVVHELHQVNSIYIFCGHKARHQRWGQQWSKIKGFFTDIQPICEALRTAVQECDQNTISMSFVPVSADGTSQNLDQINPSCTLRY